MIKKEVIMRELMDLTRRLVLLEGDYMQSSMSMSTYSSAKQRIYEEMSNVVDDAQESAVNEYKEKLFPRTKVNVHNPKIVNIAMDEKYLLGLDENGNMYNGSIDIPNNGVSWQKIKQDFI